MTWALALCGIASCADGEVVDVYVDNLVGPVSALQVSAHLDGNAASRAEWVRRGLSHFRVRLPAGSSGRLVLDLVAQYEEPCWAALGQGTLDLHGASGRSLRVAMSPLQKDGCRLQVQLSGLGGGRVVSTDSATIDCPGRCEASFATGTRITLRAQVSPRSAWGGWSRACADQPGVTCSLTVNQAVDVSATLRHTALLAVWGSGDTVWIAGPAGLLARRDARSARWTKVHSGTSEDLRGIGGHGADDLWAVGEQGTLVRWRNGEAALVPSGTTSRLDGVWCGAVECWAVGQSGTVLRWLDGAWLKEPDLPSVALHAVWGSGDGVVWAAGDDGILLRRGADGWRRESSGTTRPLYGLSGRAADDVWAVGAAGTVLRWDGQAWSAAGPLVPSVNLRGVWSLGAGSVVAVGDGGLLFTRQGGQFHPMLIGNEDLLGVWELWAVGARGGIYGGPQWVIIG